MRSFLDAVPLVRALRVARSRRDRGALSLFSLLALVALLIAAEPLSPGLVAELMRVHHFTPTAISRWIGLQIVPKPYAFSHQLWFASAPLDPADPGATEGLLEQYTLNHYPGRVTRFETVRAPIREEVRELGVMHLLARSSYRGQTLSTAYAVRLVDGVLVVTRESPSK